MKTNGLTRQVSDEVVEKRKAESYQALMVESPFTGASFQKDHLHLFNNTVQETRVTYFSNWIA